jgi:hypothetical protein
VYRPADLAKLESWLIAQIYAIRVAIANSVALERFDAVARFTMMLNQCKNGLLYGAIMAKARNCGERQTWCRGGCSLRGD